MAAPSRLICPISSSPRCSFDERFIYALGQVKLGELVEGA